MKDQNGTQSCQVKKVLFRISLITVPMLASALTGAVVAYIFENDPLAGAGMALTGGVVALAMLFGMIDIFWG